MVTQSYVDEACMIGNDNAEWVPLALDGGNPEDAYYVLEEVRNKGSTDYYLQYVLPLPTNRGGKSLRLARVKVMLAAANDDNYLNMIKVLGITFNTITSHYSNLGDWKSQQAVDKDITPDKNCQFDNQIIVTLHIKATNANSVQIAGVLLKVYYA